MRAPEGERRTEGKGGEKTKYEVTRSTERGRREPVRGANELGGERLRSLTVEKSAGRLLKFRRFYMCHRIEVLPQLKFLSLVDSYQLSLRWARRGRGVN